jgi:hypothetical protein
MKWALLAALLITLPALAAGVYGVIVGNWFLVAAAAASFAINTLPFVAAGFMIQAQGGDSSDLSH